MDCIEFSLSVTIEIWDYRERNKCGSRWVVGQRLCDVDLVLVCYLKLRGEYGFKLQAQNVLAVFQCRRRPLLVTAQILQCLLCSLSGLKFVHHLTCKKIGTFIAPPKCLRTRKWQKMLEDWVLLYYFTVYVYLTVACVCLSLCVPVSAFFYPLQA